MFFYVWLFKKCVWTWLEPVIGSFLLNAHAFRVHRVSSRSKSLAFTVDPFRSPRLGDGQTLPHGSCCSEIGPQCLLENTCGLYQGSRCFFPLPPDGYSQCQQGWSCDHCGLPPLILFWGSRVYLVTFWCKCWTFLVLLSSCFFFFL